VAVTSARDDNYLEQQSAKIEASELGNNQVEITEGEAKESGNRAKPSDAAKASSQTHIFSFMSNNGKGGGCNMM